MPLQLPPEVFILLSQCPLPIATLGSCCLVSHAFQAIFRPVLYRRYVIETIEDALPNDPKILRAFGSPKDQDLIQELEVFFARAWDITEGRGWPQEKLRNLVSLDATYEAFFLEHYLYKRVWDIIDKSLLKEVSLNFIAPYIGDVNHTLSRNMSEFNDCLYGYGNLRKLELRGAIWSLESTKLVATILLASPQLKVLALSVQGLYYWPHFEETDPEDDDLIDLLSALLEDIKTQRDGAVTPLLQLHELTLGLGMIPSKERTDLSSEAFSTLTDLSQLRVLGIENIYCGPAAFELNDENNYLEMDPNYFRSCTRLESLRVDIMSSCAVDLLSNLRHSRYLKSVAVMKSGFGKLLDKGYTWWCFKYIEEFTATFRIPEEDKYADKTAGIWKTWGKFRNLLAYMPNLRHLNQVTCSQEAAENLFQLHADEMQEQGRYSKLCRIQPKEPINGHSGAFERRWKNTWSRDERDWDVVIDLIDVKRIVEQKTKDDELVDLAYSTQLMDMD